MLLGMRHVPATVEKTFDRQSWPSKHSSMSLFFQHLPSFRSRLKTALYLLTDIEIGVVL